MDANFDLFCIAYWLVEHYETRDYKQWKAPALQCWTGPQPALYLHFENEASIKYNGTDFIASPLVCYFRWVISSFYLSCMGVYILCQLSVCLLEPIPIPFINWRNTADNSNASSAEIVLILSLKGNQALVTNANRSWAHLGYYPNNCFPEPSTCPNGITVSLWFKVRNINLS